MNIIAGLTDAPSHAGSFALTADRIVRMAAPTSFTAQDVAALQRDCEILMQRARANPDKLEKLLNLASAGDLAGARRVANELQLVSHGSGHDGVDFVIVIILIIILVCVATDAR